MISKKRKGTKKIIDSLVPKPKKRCTNASEASTDENNTESDDDEEMFFECYHCGKRFTFKPGLKKHEKIHRYERLIKTMRHPFSVEWDSDDEPEHPLNFSRFLSRNLPISLQEKLNRPKSKFVKKIYHLKIGKSCITQISFIEVKILY